MSFVQEELRTRQYVIDGEIENEIAVDSENIKITKKEEEIEEAKTKKDSSTDTLTKKFANEKNEELNTKGRSK